MKKTNIVFVTAILCILVVSLFISAVNNKKNNINQGVNVYYVDTESQELKSEIYNIAGSSKDEILTNAIKMMRSKPKNEKYAIAIPEDVEINGFFEVNGVIGVNFSEEYNNMTKSGEMYCRGAIIKTLTELYFVDKIEFFVSGEPLKRTNGEPIGPVGSDDIIINGVIEAEPITSVKVVTLYFANSNLTGLVQEERRIEVNRTQPIEKYIIEELVKGPQQENNIATVPAETKVRNLAIQDGICYVDLSSDFVSKQVSGMNDERLTIYSIVNSLSAINSNISKVQFLIEGERQEMYKNLEFSQPFEPKDLIE